MNAGASTSAVPSPLEGSGTAWVLLGSWALSPARPTPIHPRPERRGFSALLVTKAELRQHVWGSTHVSDTVLRVCVQEIRAALGDAAAAPQYLETVEPQGYRFRLGEATEDSPPR